MKRPPIAIVERDPGAVLKVNIYVTLFALFSVAYFVAAAWIVSAATDAWGQHPSSLMLFVLVGVYGWLLVRMLLLKRRILGEARLTRDVCKRCGYDLEAIRGPRVCPECGDSEACSACGYDLKGLAAGTVCPECGKREETK